MRKTIKNSETELAPEETSWLDVRTIARVEVTSEDRRYPIESAFDETDERGWLAAERRKQNIRLFSMSRHASDASGSDIARGPAVASLASRRLA